MKPLLLALLFSLLVTSRIEAETLTCETAGKPTLTLPDKLALPGSEQATLVLHTPDEVYSAVLLASIFEKLNHAGYEELVSAWRSMPAQGIQRVVALHSGTATLSKSDPADVFYERVVKAFFDLGWDEYRTYAMSGIDSEWEGYDEDYIHEDWIDFSDKFVVGEKNTGLDYRVSGAPLFVLELTSLFPKAIVSERLCVELSIIASKEEIAGMNEEIVGMNEEIVGMNEEIAESRREADRYRRISEAARALNATLTGAIDSLSLGE